MKNKKALNLNGEELYLSIGEYSCNGRLAIICETVDELFSDITINLPDLLIADNDCGFLDPIIKDCGLEQLLIDKGIIKEIIDTYQYNMGRYNLARFNLEKLKEYDSKGYDDYMENHLSMLLSLEDIKI